MIKVLFICLGNICRSPTAEGIFRQQVAAAGLQDKIYIDSAGTSAMHTGKAPDQRSQATGLKRGYDLSTQKARQVNATDLEEFDYLLVMDKSNRQNVQALATNVQQQQKIQLMLSYGTSRLTQVPDPYYGGDAGFEQVVDLLEDSCAALLAHLQKRHQI